MKNAFVEEFRSTKKFIGFPCTHRQWRADHSHCKYVHGYSRDFYFEFACSKLTEEMWVVDFGGLKEVKSWLDYMFDHTFLASDDDPHLEKFREFDKLGIIQLRTLPNAGIEGSAQFVFVHVDKMIRDMTKGRAWVTKVEIFENEKNSAIYQPNLLRGEIK